MGYMGFGMRKEVYTRKPKTPFKKMKELYGDKLEDYYRLNRKSKLIREKLTDDQREEIRRMVRKVAVRDTYINIIAAIATIIVVGLALYFGIQKL